jgi:hypothetical protein
VVLCGELVNLRLRNISNSTEPREKKIHGRTTRVATPYYSLQNKMYGRHVPKLSGNGREDTIGKVNTSEME